MELARSILGVGGQHDGYSKGAPLGECLCISGPIGLIILSRFEKVWLVIYVDGVLAFVSDSI